MSDFPGTVALWIDDEAAGGEGSWREFTCPGAIPRVGDTIVTGRGNLAGAWVVDAVLWSFVQPGSMYGNQGEWAPHVRLQVHRDPAQDRPPSG
jgi:hypothetical protein